MKRFLLVAVLCVTSASAWAASSYVPSDAERARWTMFDMHSWKIALSAYRSDHGVYPTAKTLDEARAAVEPMYIAHAPMTDAWGNPYRIESNATSFQVISAGADGVFERDLSKTGVLPSFNDDAVATESGNWLVRRWNLK